MLSLANGSIFLFGAFHASLVLSRSLTCYLRDIYYRDPNLFVNQTVVDRHVDRIARTFGVARADLNVVS